MSKLDDAAASMIANYKANTGKTLEEWVVIARATGLQKHGQILKYLKGEHGMTHGYANLVSIKARESDDAGEVDLVGNQYSGAKADLRPIYDALIKIIESFGDDVELAPKKAYVSLRRSKQFGLVQPSTKTRVDVGLNLKDHEVSERLEKSGSFNSMVSHRVRLTALDQVDDELTGWLREAYERA